MDCFRKKWYVRWLKNGWMTSGKKPVENREIWEALLPFLDEHDITFYRVKGHVSVDWHLSQNKSDDSVEQPDANLDSQIQPIDYYSSADDFLKSTYSKFCEWNGDRFSFNDFIYVTRMNNRADKLANEGMDQYR
jgi:ribonuclease HI